MVVGKANSTFISRLDNLSNEKIRLFFDFKKLSLISKYSVNCVFMPDPCATLLFDPA